MQYVSHYASPLGDILLSTDEIGLTGLWLENQKYYAKGLSPEHVQMDTPILTQAYHWLELYFSGKNPDFSVPLHPTGTGFQKSVWEILCRIPYGQTVTYKDIAEEIATHRQLSTMSSQAVGGAVGHNPISIMIPCHRVIGSNGKLTGYAGGLHRKQFLLELEGSLL